MRGSLRLTFVTAATLASLLIGMTGLTALADDHRGRGNGHGRGQGQVTLESHNDDLVTGPGRPTGTGRPTGHARPCPETEDDVATFEFENHGHYVSCVARGEIEMDDEEEFDNHGEMVREAAHSDIGKPEHEDDD